MSNCQLARAASLVLLLVLWTPPASALGPAGQDPAEGQESVEPEVAEPVVDEPALQVPTTVEEALALEDSDLEEAFEALSAEDAGAFLTGWMTLVDLQQATYEEAVDAGAETGEHAAAMEIGTDRDTLLGRAERMHARLLELGGQDDLTKDRIASIREAEVSEDSAPTVPVNQETAQSLDTEVLKALLRPLTLEQAVEQQILWLDLLQKKCNEVRNVEVTALLSEEAAKIEEFNTTAVERRGERSRLIQRVQIVIDAVEAKGGDVTEARAYVESVVVTPPITGVRAAWVTALAWMTNEDGGLALARKLGLAFGVLFASWIVAKLMGGLARRAMRRMRKTSALLRGFVAMSVQRMVLLLGALVAVGQLGVNMGPWLAAIGAAGLVVGLALQGTLSNFASGIMIMIYRPFDIGDVIATAGPTGTVKGMTLVTTTVTTFDNQTVYIPNNKIWGDVITNITANPTRRIDMVFGIGYGDDMQKAKQVLLEVLSAHEKVLADPEPNVQVHELADSSVNFIVRPWVKTEDYWDVYWDLTQGIKERFDNEGISIPFPQRDVHMISAGGGESGVWIQPAQSSSGARPAPVSGKEEPASTSPGEE